MMINYVIAGIQNWFRWRRCNCHRNWWTFWQSIRERNHINRFKFIARRNKTRGAISFCYLVHTFVSWALVKRTFTDMLINIPGGLYIIRILSKHSLFLCVYSLYFLLTHGWYGPFTIGGHHVCFYTRTSPLAQKFVIKGPVRNRSGPYIYTWK